MKTWMLAVVLAAVAIAPFLYLAYHMHQERQWSQQPRLQDSIATVDFQTETTSVEMEVGSVFVVLSCQVLDGYQFLLNLEGAGWIEAHLPVATDDEAIPVVIESLNNTTPPLPTVKLLRDVGGVYWIVDLHLTMDGKRERLVDVLREQDLTLD